MSNENSILHWVARVKQASDFSVTPIALQESTDWSFDNGVIRHASHRFFTVIGAHWKTPSGQVVEQPFLEQPEVGTLGFLIRQQQAQPEILVQAKVEPGNVGVVQLAPTCQATSSNAHQVHGGTKPPFIEVFAEHTSAIIYDVLQSEQGTRFYGKRNRNMCMLTQKCAEFSPDTHRWVSMQEIFDLMWQDFLINTDARSVLVCSPWEMLLGRQPFSRYPDGFGAELALSFQVHSMPKSVTAFKSEIQFMRTQAVGPQRIDLAELDGWQITPEGIASTQQIFQVRQMKIIVKGREVPTWDQPIIESGKPGMVFLECARIKGVVHFLFRAATEPGLYHQVELTPTTVIEPGMNSVLPQDQKGEIKAECWQSEEGGRFYQDKNLFRIIDVGQAQEPPPRQYWLTLQDIKSLLQEEGWLTNEARSVLSLLLPWM